MSLRTREVSKDNQSTPHSSATNFNDEEFLEIIERLLRRKLKIMKKRLAMLLKPN